MNLRHYLEAAGGLLLLAASQLAQAGPMVAINHTKWAINYFIIDGHPGIDSIGPFQGGGGGYGYEAPQQWRPGLTVKIDWETGVGYSMDFPGYKDWDKYLAWEKKINAQKRQHRKVVPVPDYTGQETCGMTVHFLPCDELKVTTSCITPGRPGYPYNLPLEMPEPKVCPK